MSSLPSELAELQLPQEVQIGLPRFCEQIHSTLGNLRPDLLAVLLYGHLVKSPPEPGPTEVLLVLTQISAEHLERLAPPIRQGLQDFRLSVMLLTPEDLARSTDVFPIKFADIHRHHLLLWGNDPLQELQITAAHLRLRRFLCPSFGAPRTPAHAPVEHPARLLSRSGHPVPPHQRSGSPKRPQ